MTVPTIAPGPVLHPSGIEWGVHEIIGFHGGGRFAERIGPRPKVEAVVAVHEVGHVVIQFVLGKRLAGASIIPWEGHSLGRASSRKPTPELLKNFCARTSKRKDFALVTGVDLSEVEASTEKLLADYWSLARPPGRCAG